MKAWNRIRLWAARPRLEAELREEMAAHREMLEEKLRGEGMSPEEARLTARRRFGGELSAREQSRDEWGFAWLDAILRDLRFAGRLLRRRPVLTAAAVLTLALGVGANTAVVSVLQTVLLNPYGLRDAGRVQVATVRFESLNMRDANTSGVEFRELQSMSDVFSAVATQEGRSWTAEVAGEPVRLLGRAVTPDLFRVFGTQPLAGRFFTAEDRESVVLSHGLWRSGFGADPSVIGGVLMLDGKPHRIVGIAPERFRYPADAQIWTPLILSPARLSERGNNMNLTLLARLKEGVTPTQAANRVSDYVAALKASGSADGREMTKFGYYVDLKSLARHVSGDLQGPLILVWAAALVVLAAGCANVAVLLLSRTAGRRREMAIRLALGATRWQIVRQLLVESLVLGALGGAAGIAVALAAVSSLTELPIPERRLLELAVLDQRQMLLGLALSLLSGLIFGIAPAIQLLRESQVSALARSRRRRFQDVFVAAEVAAALLLVVTTGLLLRSFWTVRQVRPGFDSANLTTAYLLKPGNDPGFVARLEEAVPSSGGVHSAALVYPLPYSGEDLLSLFSIRGRQRQPGEPEWLGRAYFISPSYFETLRVPILRGRGLLETDGAGTPLVCVIDASLAKRFFPNQEPLGQEIRMYKGWARIVGIAAPIRASTLEEGPQATVYYSNIQVPLFSRVAMLVRSPAAAGAVIRDAVRRTNGSVPVFDVRSMEDRITESFGLRRVMALLVCAFAAVCLLLAAVGLHGVVAQGVGERTSEIGVRLALGASPGQILARFLAEGLRAGAAGLLIGLAATVFVQRWLAGLLYEVKPFDPPTFVAAGAGVITVVLLAVWWPACRASRIDPQAVLRYE